MERVCRFLLPVCFEVLAVMAVFGVLVLVGCSATQISLFHAYARAFPMFGVALSPVMAYQLCGYIRVAVSFGARRTDCFRVFQLGLSTVCLAMVALGLLVQRLSREDVQYSLFGAVLTALLALLMMNLWGISALEKTRKNVISAVGFVLELLLFLGLGILSGIDFRANNLLWLAAALSVPAAAGWLGSIFWFRRMLCRMEV